MDTIILSGKRELAIYINPQRQRLLRCMELAQTPQTPKRLAEKMDISPSAVQHHLKMLMELGLVEVSHTERIHGITASYYRALPKTVSIGGPLGSLLQDESAAQRLALMQHSVSAVFEGFSAYCKGGAGHAGEDAPHGDVLTGILHLAPEEAKELYGMIRAYLDLHQTFGAGSEPWEYALIAYPVRGGTDA
ncbi:MAG: winged helix-turn-helix domain-containing protein [Clostridiaceae bacterium]